MKEENKNTGQPDKEHAGSSEGEGTSQTRRENKPLPGEYPPNEDIMNRKNTERVSVDTEKISRTPGARPPEEEGRELNESPGLPAEEETTPAAESDLTREDYEALGPRDLSLDGGDDEQLKHRTWPVDFAARDLDVPSGDQKNTDALDQGDEENDHYSLGGDDKDSLEDDPTRTFG